MTTATVHARSGLIIVGDEAWTPEEWEAHERRRKRHYTPEQRARASKRARQWQLDHPERYREIRRAWNERHRRHVIGSLHSLACIGPTKATGCVCRKVRVYDKPEPLRAA